MQVLQKSADITDRNMSRSQVSLKNEKNPQSVRGRLAHANAAAPSGDR